MDTQEYEYDLVVDPGASTTKVCLSVNGKVDYLAMSPYCVKIPESMAIDRTALHGMTSLESSYVGDIDGYYALGNFARKFENAVLSNQERKYQKALYKALGILGYFSEVYTIPNGTSISVGVLLPFREYVTKDAFIKEFTQATEDFIYCGSLKNFKLEKLSVYPEGAGTCLRGLPKGITAKECCIGSLVIGHRNASWLVYNRTHPDVDNSNTSDLGFRWLVNEIKAKTGYDDELWITEQLFDEEGDREVKAVAAAIEHIYWGELEAWISKQFRCDYVIVSGGTALRERSQINTLLSGRVLWPDILHKEIKKQVQNEFLAFRFVDPTGVLKAMLAKRGY
jgi:hypothetical protein